MSEFRLVFRGELLAGQHQAVVKQRLGAFLKVDGARLDALFTGKAVTVRKSADGDTAARFEIAFKRAGAKLRVVRLEPPPAASASPAVPQVAAFDVAAPGARLQQPIETAPVAVDVSHLSLAAPGSRMSDVPPAAPVHAPDVSHLSVAEVGADMAPRKPLPEPVVDVDAIDFEIAPPGVRMADAVDTEPPPAPDTSHLRLQ